jgi:hypothetical protein
MTGNWSDEETDEPLIADHRNFYKVEKWSRGGERVTELLFAGSSLDKAKRVFDRWAKHRPRIRMTGNGRACCCSGQSSQPDARRGAAHRREHRQAAGAAKTAKVAFRSRALPI